MTISFAYGVTRLGDLRIEKTTDEKADGVGRQSPKERTTKPTLAVEVEGTPTIATQRFWQSLASRFRITQQLFHYFQPHEVLTRVAEQAPDDKVRYCMEHSEGRTSRLLAISNPKRPLAQHDELVDLLRRSSGGPIAYADGIVSKMHKPTRHDSKFEIGGEQFKRRFVFEAPVDGFGQPRIFTSFLRQVCANGMIGYCQAFRSDIALGENATHSIRRALESYDDAEGYEALGQRFESAQTSFASVRECMQVEDTLRQIKLKRGSRRQRLSQAFEQRTGDLNELYGVANLRALSQKRQRILPSRARVYDLLNFASEVATHHALPSGGRQMQALIGKLVADEYDLEGTADAAGDFGDFLVPDEKESRKAAICFAN